MRWRAAHYIWEYGALSLTEVEVLYVMAYQRSVFNDGFSSQRQLLYNGWSKKTFFRYVDVEQKMGKDRSTYRFFLSELHTHRILEDQKLQSREQSHTLV